MVERRATAEVVPFDEGDRQTALRRIVRERQAVNAAAYDENVERTGSQAVEIANDLSYQPLPLRPPRLLAPRRNDVVHPRVRDQLPEVFVQIATDCSRDLRGGQVPAEQLVRSGECGRI